MPKARQLPRRTVNYLRKEHRKEKENDSTAGQPGFSSALNCAFSKPLPQQLPHSCNSLKPEVFAVKSRNPKHLPLKGDDFSDTMRGHGRRPT
ncbi:hypothetical protein BHM03_00058540 [Ensete ventricosum]|nr:hypothetical protein BHM03_00058540 [Ensete ventricosum]